MADKGTTKKKRKRKPTKQPEVVEVEKKPTKAAKPPKVAKKKPTKAAKQPKVAKKRPTKATKQPKVVKRRPIKAAKRVVNIIAKAISCVSWSDA